MTRRVAAVVVALALATPVSAQPVVVDPKNQVQAEALYATGKAHYDLGEYAEAAAAFKEAYRLTGEPRLLFNIAQAERKHEECAGALTTYRSYLRNLPDAPNRAKVEEFIAEAEACVAREAAAPTDAGPTDAGPTDAGPTDAGPTDAGPTDAARPGLDAVATSRGGPGPSRGGALRVAGLATVGAGVVALGIGGYFARTASAKADQLDACQPCTPDQWQPIDRDGRAAQRGAWIALTVGGAGVVTGVALYVLGVRARAGEAPVTIAPTAGGATVQATLAF